MQGCELKSRWWLLLSVVLVAVSAGAAKARGGCPCDGNVDNAGIVNILDALAVLACVNGDCSGCVNSCDVNCDGTVDYVDFGVTWCIFEGGADCCNDPTGACSIQNDQGEFPDCFITLAGACVFWADQYDGQYHGDGTTLAVCGIPAVSEWGLVVLTLALLASGTIVVSRRRPRGRTVAAQ